MPTTPPWGASPGPTSGNSRVSNWPCGALGSVRGTSEAPLSGAGPLISIGRKITASATRTAAPISRCFRAGSIGLARHRRIAARNYNPRDAPYPGSRDRAVQSWASQSSAAAAVWKEPKTRMRSPGCAFCSAASSARQNLFMPETVRCGSAGQALRQRLHAAAARTGLGQPRQMPLTHAGASACDHARHILVGQCGIHGMHCSMRRDPPPATPPARPRPAGYGPRRSRSRPRRARSAAGDRAPAPAATPSAIAALGSGLGGRPSARNAAMATAALRNCTGAAKRGIGRSSR